MTETVKRNVLYDINVELAVSLSCTSPVSGELIRSFGLTKEEAKQNLDLMIWKEAEDRGLSVRRLPVGQPQDAD